MKTNVGTSSVKYQVAPQPAEHVSVIVWTLINRSRMPSSLGQM